MPFGYPNGGMENPQITFMSPSVIKAGKDACDVAAHEIAHSWFGNLVTCGNWSHTWLNEGFTVFMERKIIKKFYGETFYEESAYIGMENLRKEIESYSITPGRNNEGDYKKLLCFSNRISPEFCFTKVQYEKGFALVLKLEVTFTFIV
jgi:leukotriene-A4 hydrolase